MNDRPPIAVTTEEILMLLGRLYLENYTLQKRIAELLRPPAPPVEVPPEGPRDDPDP